MQSQSLFGINLGFPRRRKLVTEETDFRRNEIDLRIKRSRTKSCSPFQPRAKPSPTIRCVSCNFGFYWSPRSSLERLTGLAAKINIQTNMVTMDLSPKTIGHLPVLLFLFFKASLSAKLFFHQTCFKKRGTRKLGKLNGPQIIEFRATTDLYVNSHYSGYFALGKTNSKTVAPLRKSVN